MAALVLISGAETGAGTVDITAQGFTDYGIWLDGSPGGNPGIRKSGGPGDIGPLLTAASGISSFNGFERTLTWSDGTAGGSPSTGICFSQTGGTGTQLQVTQPIGTVKQRFVLYIGSWQVQSVRLTATLSDGSVAPLVAEYACADDSGRDPAGMFVVEAAAASSGQTILFALTANGVYDTGACVEWQAMGYLPAAGGGGDVTVALTGAEGTSAVGSVTNAQTAGVTGVAGTGAVGTIVQSISKALTNNVGTGAVGTVAGSLALASTGAGATGDVGSVAVSGSSDVTVALTGAESIAAAGDLVGSLDASLAGVAGAASVGDLPASSVASLSGGSAAGGTGSLSVAVDFALTGLAGTASAGDFAPDTSAALAGIQAVAAVGDVVGDTGSPGTPLTGTSAAGAFGIVGASITIALDGVVGVGDAGTVALPTIPVVLGSLVGRPRLPFPIRSSVQTSTRRNEQRSKR